MNGKSSYRVRVFKQNSELSDSNDLGWTKKKQENRNEAICRSNNIERSNSRASRLSFRMSAVKLNANKKFGSLKLKMNKFTKWIQQTTKGNGYKGDAYSPLQNAKSPVKLYSPFYILTPSPHTEEFKCRQNLYKPRRCEFSSPIA